MGKSKSKIVREFLQAKVLDFQKAHSPVDSPDDPRCDPRRTPEASQAFLRELLGPPPDESTVQGDGDDDEEEEVRNHAGGGFYSRVLNDDDDDTDDDDDDDNTTTKTSDSFAKQITEYQKLERYAADSIAGKLKQKNRDQLAVLSRQLHLFATGTAWFTSAALFTLGEKTWNIFQDISGLDPKEVYEAAERRSQSIAAAGGVMPQNQQPYRVLRYVLTQKVHQQVLDRAIRGGQKFGLTSAAAADGQAMWIALMKYHYPNTQMFDHSVKEALDTAKLSDFKDLDGFIDHIEHNLRLAQSDTAIQFLPRLFTKLLDHECEHFTERIKKKHQDWMDQDLDKDYNCYDLLTYSQQSQDVLEQGNMYRTKLKPSSQTDVQALVVENVPRMVETLKTVVATIASHDQRLSQFSSSGGRQRSDNGNQQSVFKAAGWDEAKRKTPPEDGGSACSMLNGTPIFYCEKCGWNQTHVTEQHRKGGKRNNHQQKKKNNKRKDPDSNSGESKATKTAKALQTEVNFLSAFNTKFKSAAADSKKAARKEE